MDIMKERFGMKTQTEDQEDIIFTTPKIFTNHWYISPKNNKEKEPETEEHL